MKRIQTILDAIARGEEFCIYECPDGYQYLLEVIEKCTEYNQLNPLTQGEEQIKLLKGLFKKTGDFLMVTPPFHCTVGGTIEVGENFECSYNVTMQDLGGIKIGDNVMIGPDVSINTSGHALEWERRIEGWSYANPITIGDNVFIGAGSVLCAGVKKGLHIGNNVTIGAGSVVTKDIPDNVLAAGNPCRVIRKLGGE